MDLHTTEWGANWYCYFTWSFKMVFRILYKFSLANVLGLLWVFRYSSRVELAFWWCADSAGYFYNVNVHVLLQFLQECDFYNKNLKSFSRVEFLHNSNMIFTNYYTFTLFTLYCIHYPYYFMPVGWDVKLCPLSRITTHFAPKRNRLVRATRETFTTDHFLLIVVAVI